MFKIIKGFFCLGVVKVFGNFFAKIEMQKKINVIKESQQKRMKKQNMQVYDINGIKVTALNKRNAIRKAKLIKPKI